MQPQPERSTCAAGGAERTNPRLASFPKPNFINRIVTFKKCLLKIKERKEGPFSHVVRRSNQRFSSQSYREIFF
ncbi:hypothetical protein MtrunA17_Chr3g0094971 [Medicago truncatula]|uniref:Uncharacterized protein n=1 Tax=Medicago truncatula TaxID=3880 RepID=A0A072THH9_MEDTR|nr:hypothetical protein MTR_0082s0170 [Medicago truncatula]RHN66751.1 hypothetical protein MtrunA17_Chr3g0094971 [Medicago truncatula]